MGRSAQQALNRERRAKLQQLLQHRHVQLKSPAMVFQAPSSLDPKKDKDYRAAFILQDRANEICRKSDKCAQAWKLVCGRMVLTDLGKYTTALQKFLDEMENGVAGTMASTPQPSVSGASGQSSKAPQSHCSNQTLPAQSLRGALPSPTSSRVSVVQLPPRAAKPAQRSTVMAPSQPYLTPQASPRSSAVSPPMGPPRSYVTPQTSPIRAPMSQPSRMEELVQPNISKKRKAEEDNDEMSMAAMARALRDETKRAQFNSELTKHGLAWSLTSVKEEQKTKEEPEQFRRFGSASISGFVPKKKIKQEAKEMRWAGPAHAFSFSTMQEIKQEFKEPEELGKPGNSRGDRAEARHENKTRYGGFWSPKEEGQESEKTQYYDFEIY